MVIIVDIVTRTAFLGEVLCISEEAGVSEEYIVSIFSVEE
jgi:hypothetical protein